MGNYVKMLYLHLPIAWFGMISFFLVFIFSILYLFKNREKYDILAETSAELGVFFATLTLITGSLWAKGVWGVFWVWEPRLTTTLVMWFVYVGYLLLRNFIDVPDKRARISAVLGIVAFLDLPLVHFSVKLWRSVHPLIFEGAKKIHLDPSMKLSLYITIIPIFFFYILLFHLRYRIALVENFKKEE